MPSACVAPPAVRAIARRCPRGARSCFGPRLKRRWRRSRCAIASPAMTLSSYAKSCSARASARVRWTRSSRGRARAGRASRRSARQAARLPGAEHGRDRLAHRWGARALWGIFDPTTPTSPWSLTGTRITPRSCWPTRGDRDLGPLVGLRALAARRRQLCWAHLNRDFKAHAEGLTAEAISVSTDLRCATDLLGLGGLPAHRRPSRAETHDRSLQRQYKPIIRSFAAKRSRNRRCRGMARNLPEGVARTVDVRRPRRRATHQQPRRALPLRHAVIYRKLSLGSRSEGGEQRVARLLSAHTTCRLQGRSLFAYLTDAITAHARGEPAPLLT